MSKLDTELRLDGLFILQIILVVLKLIGVPNFAEASWAVIFIPTFVAIGFILVSMLIIITITLKKRR